MNATPLGKIISATPGTPVPILAGPHTDACRIRLQALAANTGNVYIGSATMVKATLAGVLHVFRAPAATGPLETFEIDSNRGEDELFPAAYAVDADNATEGVLASYWVE